MQWKIDSAAIGDWHVGNGPDPRTNKTLKKNGITDYKHRVRQVCTAKGDWHVGKGPDPRTNKTLKKNGATNCKHRVRQVCAK